MCSKIETIMLSDDDEVEVIETKELKFKPVHLKIETTGVGVKKDSDVDPDSRLAETKSGLKVEKPQPTRKDHDLSPDEHIRRAALRSLRSNTQCATIEDIAYARVTALLAGAEDESYNETTDDQDLQTPGGTGAETIKQEQVSSQDTVVLPNIPNLELPEPVVKQEPESLGAPSDAPVSSYRKSQNSADPNLSTDKKPVSYLSELPNVKKEKIAEVSTKVSDQQVRRSGACPAQDKKSSENIKTEKRLAKRHQSPPEEGLAFPKNSKLQSVSLEELKKIIRNVEDIRAARTNAQKCPEKESNFEGRLYGPNCSGSTSNSVKTTRNLEPVENEPNYASTDREIHVKGGTDATSTGEVGNISSEKVVLRTPDDKQKGLPKFHSSISKEAFQAQNISIKPHDPNVTHEYINSEECIAFTHEEMKAYANLISTTKKSRAKRFTIANRNTVEERRVKINSIVNSDNLQYITEGIENTCLQISPFENFINIFFLIGNNYFNNLRCPILSKLRKPTLSAASIDDLVDVEIRRTLTIYYDKLVNFTREVDSVKGQIIGCHKTGEDGRWITLEIRCDADVQGFGWGVALKDEKFYYFGWIVDKQVYRNQIFIHVDLFEWHPEVKDEPEATSRLDREHGRTSYQRIEILQLFQINFYIMAGKELIDLPNRPWAHCTLTQNYENWSADCIHPHLNPQKFGEIDRAVIKDALTCVAEGYIVSLDGGKMDNIKRLTVEIINQISLLRDRLAMYNKDLKENAWISSRPDLRLEIRKKVLIISCESDASRFVSDHLGARAVLIKKEIPKSDIDIKRLAGAFSRGMLKLEGREAVIDDPCVKHLVRDCREILENSKKDEYEYPSSILEMAHLRRLIDSEVVVGNIENVSCDPVISESRNMFPVCIIIGASAFDDGEILGLAHYGVGRWILLDSAGRTDRHMSKMFWRLLKSDYGSRDSAQSGSRTNAQADRDKYLASKGGSRHARIEREMAGWTARAGMPDVRKHYPPRS